MTDAQMLTRLIERAGTIQGDVTEDGHAVSYYSNGGSVEYLSLNDLLFGGGTKGNPLPFLKALVGERHSWKKDRECPLRGDFCGHCKEDREYGDVLTDCYEVIAKQLVELPDTSRISQLYTAVFSEDQTG